MSAIRLRFDGMTEFRNTLKQLPDNLRGEGGAIISSWAQKAYDDIYQAYPEVTGNLRRGLKLTTSRSDQFAVRAVLQSTAKHAHLYEFGTNPRYTKVWRPGSYRGFIPKMEPLGRIFIPTMIRVRRSMYLDLKALLASVGLKVSGDEVAD